MADKKRVLLLHHGSSTISSERFCGFTDPPLSAPGRQALLELRDQLIKKGQRLPNVWYISDRRRAIESFEIMTAGLYAPIVRITDKLREINFGEYENLSWEELPREFQKTYESLANNPLDLSFPSGESFRDLCERVSLNAFEILSYSGDDNEIAILGHQGSLKIWELMVKNAPPSQFFDSPIKNCFFHWIEISTETVANWRKNFLGFPSKYDSSHKIDEG